MTNRYLLPIAILGQRDAYSTIANTRRRIVLRKQGSMTCAFKLGQTSLELLSSTRDTLWSYPSNNWDTFEWYNFENPLEEAGGPSKVPQDDCTPTLYDSTLSLRRESNAKTDRFNKKNSSLQLPCSPRQQLKVSSFKWGRQAHGVVLSQPWSLAQEKYIPGGLRV